MEAKTLKKKEPETAVQKIETFLKKEKIVGADLEVLEVIIFSNKGATFLGRMSHTDVIGNLELQKQYFISNMIEQGKAMRQKEENPMPSYVR